MASNIEIRQVSENEIWVGKNKATFYTEQDQNIIHVIVIGEQTTELANLAKEIIFKFFGLAKGKISFLIDLNESGKSSPEARQIWNQFGENEKTNRVAVFGLNPVARVIASFVFMVSKNNNQRFFRTREEAMVWLLEGKALGKLKAV